MEKAIQILEENSKADLLSIHENMDALICEAEMIVIDIDNSESYQDAVSLKRVIKNTHVAIEKRRKELKAPIISAGKKLDEFAKSIYNPLKDAENLLKEKMLPYEQEQEKIKEQERLAKEKEQEEKDLLNNKLMELNSVLTEINSCKNRQQVEQIENKLDNINPSDYGVRSDEAGFIITNLKTTCMMFKKSLPDDFKEVEDDNVVINNDIKSKPVEEKEEPIVVHDGMKYNPEKAEQTLELDFAEIGQKPKSDKIVIESNLFTFVFDLKKGDEYPEVIELINNKSREKNEYYKSNK